MRDLAGAPAVLFFYPWAFSRVCGSELAALQQRQTRFAEAGARLVAISCDTMFSLRAYADQQGLTFDLITDHWPHGEIARRYGVFDPDLGVAGRGTFILDSSGVIRYRQLAAIDQSRPVDDVLASVAAL